jgi:hypothetical protein
VYEGTRYDVKTPLQKIADGILELQAAVDERISDEENVPAVLNQLNDLATDLRAVRLRCLCMKEL